MSGYIVSPQADEDIFEVWRYLFERAGAEIANRVESELYAVFDSCPKSAARFGSHVLSGALFHGLFVHDRVSSPYFG